MQINLDILLGLLNVAIKFAIKNLNNNANQLTN